MPTFLENTITDLVIKAQSKDQTNLEGTALLMNAERVAILPEQVKMSGFLLTSQDNKVNSAHVA